MPQRLYSRKNLDTSFPTVVRYVGVLLMVALCLEFIFSHLQYPSLVIAATGMILYKNVVSNGNGNRDGNGKGED